MTESYCRTAELELLPGRMVIVTFHPHMGSLLSIIFSGLTADDVLHMTPKFWELHTDNLVTLDGGAFTLLTIQYNLAGGTLAPFAEKRPELRLLMDRIMKFDVSYVTCQTPSFLLTAACYS